LRGLAHKGFLKCWSGHYQGWINKSLINKSWIKESWVHEGRVLARLWDSFMPGAFAFASSATLFHRAKHALPPA
jgi:hypothetical protein